MTGTTAKRFWKEAAVTGGDGGFGVALDGKGIRTPAKAPLLLPTGALARAVAAEWNAQGERIDPARMPLTRTANSAIDTVRQQKPAVARIIADFGGTDLLCYRAGEPKELASRQAAGWDPLLDWADEALGARLRVTEGVLPVEQPGEALSRLEAALAGLDEWQLAALHQLVSISGSLVLGLAVTRGRLDAESAWDLSRLDESWQSEQWGKDAEAVAEAALKRQAMCDAETFWRLRQSA